MDWPFIYRKNKCRDQVVAIDLGGRVTKAVHVQRRQDQYSLLNFALLDTPAEIQNNSPETLGQHLKQLHRALGNGRMRPAALAVGVSDSLFRQVELPPMPVADLRQMLKLNPKTYLQQDLADYVFDCMYQAPPPADKPSEAARAPGAAQKLKVVVGGAKKQLLDYLQAAAKPAGFQAEHILPGMVGPVNAFELAEAEAFAKEVVALVDLGYNHSTITILDGGEMILNRVVDIGGHHLTSGLSEAMGISYAEAEGIKVGMPAEVRAHLETLLGPLGRELRASIDFFEHQRDKTVSQVYVSGGAARSEFVLGVLQAEIIIPCKPWNPMRSLKAELPSAKTQELELAAPQLAVALGAAFAAL